MWILSPQRKAEPVINKKSYIQNYSCLTPFGFGVSNLWEACLGGDSRFDSGLGFIDSKLTNEIKEEWQDKFQPVKFEGAENNALLLWSLKTIEDCIDGNFEFFEDARVGVVIATTTGLTQIWENQLMNHFRNEKAEGHVYYPLGSFAVELKNQLKIKGPLQVVSSACCAGTQAVGMAQSWIEGGLVDRCLVLGAEQICQLTNRGFRALSLVNGENCRPFNEGFNSICLSESVAAIFLSDDQKDAKAQVTGFGCSSDAHSMTAPKPDGSGPKSSMKMAIQKAGLNSQDIDWVHAHGTGSLQNDRAEAAAVKQLEMECPVTSTKGVHGHTLAAAGVLETILCSEALLRQQILPTQGAEPKHFNVNLNTEARSHKVQHVLKNTLGFGGINSSLVISEVQ